MIGEKIEKSVIESDKLVGTKWVSICQVFGNLLSVEFIDNKNCVYTAEPRKFTISYSVTEGDLFINNIEGPFELRGNVLFNNDLPVFKKAA